MDKFKAVAYAQSALAFIFADTELWKKPAIKKMVLFGSAARDEATEKSDIDLFFELFSVKDENFVKNRLGFALKQFAQSRQFKEWLLRGIKNEISPFISTLEIASDLQKSLIADGIVLYSEFETKTNFQHYLLLSFSPIKKKNVRYKVERYLFGRKEKAKTYLGAVQQLNGIKIDARTFILPSLRVQPVLEKLRKERVSFTIRDFWSEQLK